MNVLIINLHSALNLGDEAIMQETLHLLKKKYPESKIALMANYPDSWNLYDDIDVFPSFYHYAISLKNSQHKIYEFFKCLLKLLSNLPKKERCLMGDKYSSTINAIKCADIIFSCGGGNYYANSFFCAGFLFNVLSLIYVGIQKKTIIMLPQSFGPFRYKIHYLILKFALKFPKKIFVRENISYELLKHMGISEKKIDVLPDLTFALSCDFKNKGQGLEKNHKCKIGITIINRRAQYKGFLDQESYQNSLIKSIRMLLEKFNASIYLFVQCYGPTDDQNDNTITQSIYNECREYSNRIFLMNKYKESLKLIEDLSKMDFIIASRMHTAIFGMINKIPSILIGYQSKAKGLYDMFELENYYIPIENIDLQILQEKILYALENYRIYEEILNQRTQKLKITIEDSILGI